MPSIAVVGNVYNSEFKASASSTERREQARQETDSTVVNLFLCHSLDGCAVGLQRRENERHRRRCPPGAQR